MSASHVEYPDWSGPKAPRLVGAPRVAGAVRRTSSMDMVHPEGPRGPLLLHGRARDVLTLDGGGVRVLAAATLDAEASPSRQLVRVAAVPDVPGLQSLLELRLASGFRAAAFAALGDAHAGSPLALLVDDLPVTAMISGVGWMREQIAREGQKRIPPVERIGTCAGWRPGGAAAARAVERQPGLHPWVARATAPEVLDGDAGAWHEMRALPPLAMRRRRRLDVVPGDPVRVEAWFRDVVVEDDGGEAALHEYTVQGFVDVQSGVVLQLDTTAHVLPYVDCPGAVPSSRMLDGTPLAALRPVVRETLSNQLGCTHLNDALRSIADVAVLLREAEAVDA